MFARVKEHLALNQTGRAANWLAAVLLINEPASVARLKQEGILRASKHDFGPGRPLGILTPLLDNSVELGLDATTVAYLKSTKNLLGLARHAEREYRELMAIVQREPFTLAHSCLVTIELLFLGAMYPELDFGLDWSIEPYTKEDIAEGFSFLWSQVYRQLGITRMTTGLWDSHGIHNGRYLTILRRAASLREFAQAEVLVEAFDYYCETSAEAVEIRPRTPEVEKSIRLGYIDHEMRGARLVNEVNETGIATLRHGGEALHEAMQRHGQIQHIREGLERVRFVFPVIPELVKQLHDKKMFAEEVAGVMAVLEDYGLTPADSDAYQVADGLSLGDIRRLQRFATLISACVATELALHRDQPAVLVNSAIPVYQSDDLLDEFLGYVLDARAAQQFRTMFRWPADNVRDSTGLDLQYRPLLEAEHEWRVPLAVLASSNLTRAALMLTNLRPAAEHDLIEDRIVTAFTECGHPAVSRTKLRDGHRDLGEIDVAALVDDVLVILECKNSILPCNLFELRTSYRLCETAAGQLDRIVSLLEDARHRDTLLKRLGATGRPVSKIVTGIAVSNRLFEGLRLGRHLVIALGAFVRFLTDGDFYFAGRLARSRGEGALTGAAVVEYLEGSFFHRVFAAMVPYARTFMCGARAFRFHTFLLDFVEFGKQFGIPITIEELEEEARRDGASL
jgi:hypothetical protein